MNFICYTTVLGETDPLKCPVPIDRAVRYECFTDRFIPRLRSSGWNIVRVKPESDPCKQSRRIKIMAHEVFPDADFTLWVDAAYRLHTKPTELVGLLGDADMVAMRHPHRDRITDEADAIVKLGIAPADQVYAQLESYRSQGFDTDANPQRAITSTGFFLRRNSDRVAAFERAWWAEVEAHTYRDQMSIDYVIQKTGVSVAYIPGHYRDNPFARWFNNANKRNNSNVRQARCIRSVRAVDGPPIASA